MTHNIENLLDTIHLVATHTNVCGYKQLGLDERGLFCGQLARIFLKAQEEGANGRRTDYNRDDFAEDCSELCNKRNRYSRRACG